MILTDSHTHLFLEEFDNDRQRVVENALKQGVTRMFIPNIDNSTIARMFQLCDSYPENCFPMMGLHPSSVKHDFENALKITEEWLQKKKFYAVGEIGIDLYWDTAFIKEQETAFRRQIVLAKELGLPVVIHCRNSFNEIFSIVDDLNDDRLKGIFHCFTGNREQAKKIIDYGGFKLGIGGVVTFKNGGLDKTVSEINIEHIVIETDSPYLAPVPYRGKRNESAYLLNIAEKVAEIYAMPVEKVAEITTKNTIEIFGA